MPLGFRVAAARLLQGRVRIKTRKVGMLVSFETLGALSPKTRAPKEKGQPTGVLRLEKL